MTAPVSKCRLCHQELVLLLDLGEQSFTGIFPRSREESVPSGPLTLVKCVSCDLVQLGHSFALDKLYGANYGYRSGLNASMMKHLKNKVEGLLARYPVKAGDLVIDIGSNDSTLLQAYPESLERVGVDPSGLKFKRYYPESIRLIPEFFSQANVEAVLGKRKAQLITSIAMFYDLEDPAAFVREVAALLAPEGVWTFEQSYLPLMLDTVSYDTICHEHLEYYALKQVEKLLTDHGLKIIAIELNDINGGSFSVSAAHQGASYPEATALKNQILLSERERGLCSLAPYLEFKERTESHAKLLKGLLEQLKAMGKTVVGYGASTKGNVLLQYVDFTSDLLPCIAEVNEDKFGAFTPGTRIPIVSENEARALSPDYFLVLPWHFRHGILKKETAFLEAGGQFIFPLPRLEIVSREGSVFPTLESLSVGMPKPGTSYSQPNV